MYIEGDVPSVITGANGGYNGGLFGGSDGWLGLIVILALFGGFGNGGWGNNGGGAMNNYVLASDFATLQRQIDSATTGLERKGDYIQEQICNSDQMNSQLFANVMSGIANTNTTLLTGLDAVNQNIATNKYENTIATLNAQNALSSQLSQCCCDARYDNLVASNGIQSSLANINYNMATNTCAINTNASNNTRDIIDAVNANGRATQDMIMSLRYDDLKTENQRLRDANNSLQLAASQARQTNQIVSALEPKLPVAAYTVPNPYTGCGCNSGCGCGM